MNNLIKNEEAIFKNLCSIDSLNPDLLNFIKILNFHKSVAQTERLQIAGTLRDTVRETSTKIMSTEKLVQSFISDYSILQESINGTYNKLEQLQDSQILQKEKTLVKSKVLESKFDRITGSQLKYIILLREDLNKLVGDIEMVNTRIDSLMIKPEKVSPFKKYSVYIVTSAFIGYISAILVSVCIPPRIFMS